MNRCHQQIHFHLLVHPLTHSFTIKNTFYVSCGSHPSTCVCDEITVQTSSIWRWSWTLRGRRRSCEICPVIVVAAAVMQSPWNHSDDQLVWMDPPLFLCAHTVCKCFTCERVHCSPKPSCPVRHKRPELTMLSVFLRQLWRQRRRGSRDHNL